MCSNAAHMSNTKIEIEIVNRKHVLESNEYSLAIFVGKKIIFVSDI